MNNMFKGYETATVSADKDYVAGAGFQIGALKGVMINTVKQNDLAEIQLHGQFMLPIKAGDTLICGAKLYLDASGHVTTAGTGDHFGVSVENVPIGAAHAVVLL